MLDLAIDLHAIVQKAPILFLDAFSRDGVLEEMVGVLRPRIPDEVAFYQAILARENVISTGIGMGIAIPHAKMESIDEFFIVIGIHKGSGIDWNGIDGLPVKLVFMIGGPQNSHKEYLKLLSQLTSFLKEERKRETLIRAKNAEEVVKIFGNC